MRRLYVLALLTILVAQPFVLMAAVPAGNGVLLRLGDSRTLAQEPGSRLNPGEYTNHVPFMIDGDSDFETQGWPGSGTEGDPYAISGLNITADVGQLCIAIWNTDAYFVIRDCFINQKSDMNAIDIQNTTHGTIEYTTVMSEGNSIYGFNANNTMVSHTLSINYDSISVYFMSSVDCNVEWSHVNSTTGVALYVMFGNYFESSHNEYVTQAGGVTAFIFFCNYSSSTFDYAEGGLSDVAFLAQLSYNLTVTDLTATGLFGLQIISSPNSNFTRCDIGPVDAYGGLFVSSPNITITESSFTEAADEGVHIESCNNTVFSNNVVDIADDYGVYISTSHSSEISFNSISNIGDRALVVEVSDDLTIDSNTMNHIVEYGVVMVASNRPTITNLNTMDTGEGGLYADVCHNGSITDSRIEDSGGEAFEVRNSDNWLIADNTIYDIDDIGIYVYNGLNANVFRNDLSILTDNGIRIDWCPDAQVVNNTISEVDSETISVSDSHRILIDSNIMTLVYSGIIVDNSDNITVSSNTITDTMSYGIHLDSLDNPTVSSNSLTALYGRGISVSTVLLGVFENNTMTDCGIWFNHGLAFQYYNHTLTGNTANDKPVLYEQNLNSADITADDYGQIILLNCTFIEIANGSFTRATTPVQLFACEEVLIESLMLDTNWRAMTINTSDNVTIREVTVVGREDGYRGIYMRFSDRTFIDDVTVSDCNGNQNYGVMFQNSNFGTVNNSVFTNNYYGVRWDASDNITVSHCDILNSESYATYAVNTGTWYSLVEDNMILNATRGFYSNNALYSVVRNNLIMYCSSQGVYFSGSSGDYGDIFHNTIENNFDGIFISASDFATITNNTIRWNSRYGIYLSGCAGPAVYYNIIALSLTDNGYDSNGGNVWDDTVVLGNWWDDWSGTGFYDVDNGNTWDNFPQLYAPTEPIINQPQDSSYAEGSTGNEITWRAFDDSLRDWEVWIDGALWEADAWDFVDITVNVDGLEYGTHTVEVTIWDIDQNNVTDTLVIDVFDDTPPSVDGPPNGLAFVDGTGQTLVWEAADLHPANYVVYLDQEVYETGTWSTGEIVIGIDGLSEGEHVFSMIVFDIDTNSDSDSILLRVIDDEVAPSIDSPTDISFLEGSIGNAIVWTPVDEYPSSFEVSFNGSIIASEDWGGSRITVSIDDLPVGTHSMTLTVYDGSGNSASDTVVVTVIPVAPATTPVQPPDFTVLILVAGGAGAAVAVVVIIVLIRRRRAT